MLAPLLDRMLARDPDARFTAAEALAFLDEFHDGYRADGGINVLQKWPLDRDHVDREVVVERWTGLPEEFVREWSRFREPPMSRTGRLLQAACEYDFISKLVRCARRVLDVVFFRRVVVTDVDFVR